MTHTGGKLSLHKPAAYRIRVQGQLDESWSPRLSGMAIHAAVTKEGNTVTTLEGTLLDQAALAGVLNTLYTLGLPMISVEHLPAEF
jgi:hypothetical protein